jgi:type II secretory pathway predicted ATPase ExeA
MLLRSFGFSEDPFGSTPDPRCLYASSTHREALASLKYGFLSNRGFTALIAPPGMGKTTLLFRFLEDIRDSARSVFLFDIDSQCEPRELVGYILRDLGITPGVTGAEMHDQLSGVLVAEARAGRGMVVVIDEAQNLSDAALEMVRLLTNFETPRAKLMQIVLAGQTQLSEKLMQPSLVQLRQRISTICRLEALSAEETTAYIEHRLKFAGYGGDPLFTKDALKEITEAGQGIPRTINTLCFNALSLCCALKRKQVDGRMAAEVISDQQLRPESRDNISASSEAAAGTSHQPVQRRRGASLVRLLVPVVALLLVLSVARVLGPSALRTYQSRRAGEVRSLDLRPLPPSVPVPVVANTSKPIVAEPTPKAAPIEVTVEPHQRLGDIALQYLGSADLQSLRQIQALNPKLIDPNHIEPGQKIRLPDPLAAPVSENAALPANVRNLP